MPDLLIRGGAVVSVFTGEMFPADVTVDGATIGGVLPPGSVGDAAETIDAHGTLIVPGFVDAHMHVESTFVTPPAFAWLTVPRGTTTVLADPHEIVNVAGREALRWMIDAGRETPQTILYGVPSCVPALLGFETAGAELGPEDVRELLDWPGVIALAEVMDYRAVVNRDARMEGIVGAARDAGKIVDGHCPGLTGEDLSRYLAAGVDSDHTKNAPAVSLEKARMGMLVMLQEKCLQPELVAGLMAMPLRPPLCLVTDDVAPDAVVAHGHLDHVGREAVEAGLPPLEALRAMTYTPAQRLRLPDRGLVSPGKRADLVLLDAGSGDPIAALGKFEPRAVLAGGKLVARDGVALYPAPDGAVDHPFGASVQLGDVSADDLRWRVELPDGEHSFTAIRANPVDTSTVPDETALRVLGGEVAWEQRVALVHIRERHGRAGTAACAPLLGFDLADGAVATTYAHDSHNLLTIGTSRAAMAAAANAVIASGGGIAVARGSEVVALLPLPVGGLMATLPVPEVAERARWVRAALDAWGYRHANAFMSVSTLGLPVSPRLKLTDLGLVDVDRRAWAAAVAC